MRYYVLDINPEPWDLGSLGVARRGGKMRATISPNQQLQAYQEAIREAIRELDPEMVSGSVRLKFFYWRNLATYRTESRTVHRKKPDVTNMNKATEDALQGILYENDRDVTDVQGVLVQAGTEVHGAVVVGIEGDTGLNLLDQLGEVVMQRLKELNENAPPEMDNSWGDDDVF
jgi:Holliday junction resolvase RusA-like endonuclease